MPFNGSGVFQRVRNWVNDASSGVKIRADYHDAEDDNIAAGITNCIARDGQSTILQPIPFNGKRITGLGDPTAAQDAVTRNWVDLNVTGGALIADTPPAAGKVGNLWWDSDSGNLFLRFDDGSSVQWVQVNSGAPAAYISDPTADMRAGFKTGSSFVVNSKADATGTDVFAVSNTGQATINKAASGATSILCGAMATKMRWTVELGDSTAESGSNVGSNFGINRYNDAGTFLSTPLQIIRSTGNVVTAGLYPTTICVAHGGGLGGLANVAGMSYDSGNGMIIENTAGASGLTLNRVGTNGSVAGFAQSGTFCGSITVANAASTAYNTSSDKRLKVDLQDFDAAPIIDATEVYNFQWKGQTARGYGVLAQDAVEVFPDAVTHDEKLDAWGVDYSKYVPLLLKEIQMLRTRVAALEGAR